MGERDASASPAALCLAPLCAAIACGCNAELASWRHQRSSSHPLRSTGRCARRSEVLVIGCSREAADRATARRLLSKASERCILSSRSARCAASPPCNAGSFLHPAHAAAAKRSQQRHLSLVRTRSEIQPESRAEQRERTAACQPVHSCCATPIVFHRSSSLATPPPLTQRSSLQPRLALSSLSAAPLSAARCVFLAE